MAVFTTEPFVRAVQRYTTDPACSGARSSGSRPAGTEAKDCARRS